MKILIAEDDVDMRKILSLYLKKEGYEVEAVSDGEAAMDALTEGKLPELLLLDWMMPGKNGIQVCRDVKALQIPVKILMLTAKSEHDHEFLGLSSGADDYLRKPFDMKILLLRIRKLLKQEDTLRWGRLSLCREMYQAEKDGEKLSLTKKEFDLLGYLMENAGITVRREQILAYVWGTDYEGEERTVDTHIRRLRGKIGEEYIKTVVGVGYIFGGIQ